MGTHTQEPGGRRIYNCNLIGDSPLLAHCKASAITVVKDRLKLKPTLNQHVNRRNLTNRMPLMNCMVQNAPVLFDSVLCLLQENKTKSY